MSLTLGQSDAGVISEASLLTSKPGNNGCKKCHLLNPKKEYRVLSQKNNVKKPHNVVFLVEDGKTGRDVKVAFLNGIKNEKGVRVLQSQFKSKTPCQKLSKRCVYRLINRKTGRPFKIDFKKQLKNGKRIVKLIP
ncbi:hypothetical protein KR054_000739 [Drosophila jambulina]|nr:hypothetical protein KR054_000739 [Drosophila jambulina]